MTPQNLSGLHFAFVFFFLSNLQNIIIMKIVILSKKINYKNSPIICHVGWGEKNRMANKIPRLISGISSLFIANFEHSSEPTKSMNHLRPLKAVMVHYFLSYFLLFTSHSLILSLLSSFRLYLSPSACHSCPVVIVAAVIADKSAQRSSLFVTPKLVTEALPSKRTDPPNG